MKYTKEELIHVSHNVKYIIMCRLLGRATKKMRTGIVNYEDNILQIKMIFDSELIDAEVKGMNDAYRDIVRDLGQEFENIDLSFEIIDTSMSIPKQKENMGSFFWRRDWIVSNT